jgi:hypothetical protein
MRRLPRSAAEALFSLELSLVRRRGTQATRVVTATARPRIENLDS